MSLKSLSFMMKTIVILLGVCGAVLFGAVVPFAGNSLAQEYPEFAYCFVPWLTFILIMALPCYAVLILAWQIAASIACENIFTQQNSARLRAVAWLALGTSVYLFLGNVVFLLLNMNHFSVLLGSTLIVFIGICVAVASAVLSHLVKRAAVLQEQSDLTI